MGAQLQNNQPLIVAGDSTWVFIAVDTAGLYKIDLQITDQLGKTTKQSLFVKSLANTAPVASLSVTLIDSSQINNWTYNLDASTSKKSDGSIISFIYNINGQAITSSKNAIRWTFHERGWQRISLFVTDDLKRASDSTIQKLFIQWEKFYFLVFFLFCFCIPMLRNQTQLSQHFHRSKYLQVVEV